ncbi:MAG: PASTA domain-containing protein, partial [Halanaerobiales bacterium]
PIDDPELVVLVALYDVTGETYYGSQTAAPVFRNVAVDSLRYLEIPPQDPSEEKEETTGTIEVPDVKDKSVEEASNELRSHDFEVKVIGDNDIVREQVPLAGADINESSTVLLFTEKDHQEESRYKIAVPDLTGFTREEASELLDQLGLQLSASGTGKIVEQEVEPGSRVKGGTVIEVELEEE